MILFLRLFLFILCFGAFCAAAPLRAQETPANPPEPAAPVAPAPEASEPAPVPPPPGKPSPPDVSMEAFGVANPDCLEWTDMCQVCARDAENNFACSTPGIACLPGEASCKSQRK
jgi:hypothetical protein